MAPAFKYDISNATNQADLLTTPFIRKGKKKGIRRDKPWWNPELASQAGERTRLYKKEIRTGLISDMRIHDKYNRKLKKEITKVNRKAYRGFMEELEQDEDHQITAKTARIAKNRRTRIKDHLTTTVGALRREDFTEYVSKKFPTSTEVKGEKFVWPPNFSADIQTALLYAGKNKASGKHPVFNEAMRYDIAANAKILYKLWEACGRLKTLWSNIILFPLHKTGPLDDTSNYRPIVFMSHICRATR